MMRWSDVGAGLRVSGRAVLRLDLWLGMLRRALFSRVFVGYAFVGVLLFMAGRQLYAGFLGGGLNPAIGIVIALIGGYLVLVLGVFLLPYCYWAFNPVAARAVQDYVALPPPLEEEPWFGAHLWWTLPVFGATVLYGALQALPAPRWLSIVQEVAATALLVLAVVNLFARSALSAFFKGEDIQSFLHATRWQRRLIWLPLLFVASWLLQKFMMLLLGAAALASLSGVLGGTATQFAFPGLNLTVLVAVVICTLVSAYGSTVFITALLLACSRMQAPQAESAAATQGSLHSVTMPYPPGGLPAAPHAAAPGASRAWRWAGGMALIVGALYMARLPLADWYLSLDASYRAAPAQLARQGQSMDASDRTERLLAGYIQAGCDGDIGRMRWLRRTGLDTRLRGDPIALACAACQGRGEAVQWMLAKDATLSAAGVRLRSEGPRHRVRSALSCSAERGDIAMAEALLARGARPGEFGPRDSAVDIAAERQNWAMVSVLLRADPTASGSAIFSALDAARAQGPQRPAELLPRMLAAGLSLNARDGFGRTVFHWAAIRHDLALAQALMAQMDRLPPEFGPMGADRQKALPWMHVLRKAEVDGRPLSAEAAELLRLLVPADANTDVLPPADKPVADALPERWSARHAVLNDPAANLALGSAFDIGRLPDDPAAWWRFSSAEAAERFVRTASITQLMRAEHPDAPTGMEPRKLSTALLDAGWPALAKEVTLAVQGSRR